METKYNETEFPRKDNYFRTKNSLSFQEMYTRVWMNREEGNWEGVQVIICFVFLGILVGLTGFLMDVIEMLLVYVKDSVT